VSVIDVRHLVGLVREAKRETGPPRPIDVSGPRAHEVAAALGVGGRPGVVRTGNGEGAALLVRVMSGAPSAEDIALLRQATRRCLPVVAVLTGDWTGRVPYVPTTEVVTVAGVDDLSIGAIASAIARAVGDDGVALAAALPALAEAVQAEAVRNAAILSAVVAATPIGGDPKLPVIVGAQTRMLGVLRRTAAATPAVVAENDPSALVRSIGPEIAAPVVVGLVARSVVRRAPGGAIARAAVAAGATLALARFVPRRARARR
jgi:hypothetical protein